MRLAIAPLLMLALAAPASAAQSDDACRSIGELSANIMRARQNGTIMSTAIAAVPADNEMKELAIYLVKKAYAVPQYSVDENRERAIVEFRNDTEFECYTSD